MKKRGGARKRGRPPGKKPTPPVDVDESAVMTLQEVAGLSELQLLYTAQKLVRRGGHPKLQDGRRLAVSEVRYREVDGEGRRAKVMMNADDEQPEREPVPRAWREEFDGLKPIRPIAYKKPAPKEPAWA